MPDNDIPWLNEGSPQNDILRQTIAGKISKNGGLPSMEELSKHKSREQGNFIEQARQSYNDNKNEYFSAIIEEMKNIGVKIDNAIDTKYLTQGTIFIVCINKNIKPDANPAELPKMLASSINSNIYVVSFQEYDTKEQLKEILKNYKILIDTYNENNKDSNVKYFVFIGRLVENISFSGLEYKI